MFTFWLKNTVREHLWEHAVAPEHALVHQRMLWCHQSMLWSHQSMLWWHQSMLCWHQSMLWCYQSLLWCYQSLASLGTLPAYHRFRRNLAGLAPLMPDSAGAGLPDTGPCRHT